MSQNCSKEKTEHRTFLETIVQIEIVTSEPVQPLKLLRDPIIQSVALKIKGTDELTMADIANNTYIPKSNLSPIGQKLYDNVSGKNFVLNTPDFPQAHCCFGG